MAANVEQQVAKIVVPMISVGFAEPCSIRIPMMVVGIKVKLDVFKANKVHMAGDAVLRIRIQLL